MNLLKVMEIQMAMVKREVRLVSFKQYLSYYRRLREHIISNGLENISVRDFDRGCAYAYLDSITDVGARTYNNNLFWCKIMFNRLLEREIILKNPFVRIRKRKVSKKSRKPYLPDEVKQILGYLEGVQRGLYLASMLCYLGGLRMREILALKVGQIDFNEGFIHLEGENTKNGESDIVMLPNRLHKALLKHTANASPDWYVVGKEKKCMIGPSPRKTSSTTVSGYYRDHIERLKYHGIIRAKDCTFYSWRDTGIKDFIIHGGSIEEAAKFYRQRDIKTTRNYLVWANTTDHKMIRSFGE